MGAVEKRQDNKIRVVLADDSSIFLTTLKRFLAQHHEFVIVGEAHNGHEALALAEQLCPDLLLLDLQMPGLSALEIIGPIRHRLPETYIIVLSLFDWREFTRSLGVHAYVSKTQFVEELLPTLHQIIGRNSAQKQSNNPLDNSR